MTLTKTATCAVSGEILPTTEMIRFVVTPDKSVVADLTQKLPGVFLWIKADRKTLQKAIRRNSFAAHTRQTVTIPENLLNTIETGIHRLALQTLSMAKGAGNLISGFTKTDEALRSGGMAVYVVAVDASDNGREKLERLANAYDIPVLSLWTSDELSAVLGDSNVHHLVVAHGGLSQKLLELSTKLKAVKSET